MGRPSALLRGRHVERRKREGSERLYATSRRCDISVGTYTEHIEVAEEKSQQSNLRLDDQCEPYLKRKGGGKK